MERMGNELNRQQWHHKLRELYELVFEKKESTELVEEMKKNLTSERHYGTTGIREVEKTAWAWQADDTFYDTINLFAVSMLVRKYKFFPGCFEFENDDYKHLIKNVEKLIERIKQTREKKIPCPYCGGKGHFGYVDQDGTTTWTCHACRGSKWIHEDPDHAIGAELCALCDCGLTEKSDHRDDLQPDHYHCHRRNENIDKPPETEKWCDKFHNKVMIEKKGS